MPSVRNIGTDIGRDFAKDKNIIMDIALSHSYSKIDEGKNAGKSHFSIDDIICRRKHISWSDHSFLQRYVLLPLWKVCDKIYITLEEESISGRRF